MGSLPPGQSQPPANSASASLYGIYHITPPRLFVVQYIFQPPRMPVFFKAIGFAVPDNRAKARRAKYVIRSIRSRYRAQAFLFLAYHFFITSPMHLDIFIIFFILVSNFMNRQQAFPMQLAVDGIRFLLDERRMIMP